MKHQQGSFIIEFALIAVFFSSLILLTADIVIKQDIAGQLDRLSYSAVNLLKERNEIYQRREEITQADVNQIKNLIENSMSRTYSNFLAAALSIKVEQQLVDINNDPTAGPTLDNGDFICDPTQTLTDLITNVPELTPVTSSGRRARLYQVTLCYEVQDFVGNDSDTIRAFSFSLGR